MTNTNTELSFNFTVEEANVILTALQELPAKIANPLTQKMHEQAKGQMPAEAAETEVVEAV
jgi:hypothetical protein